MENITELIAKRDFTKLIPLASTDAFDGGAIHDLTSSAMDYIDYLFPKFAYDEYDELNAIVVNELNFVAELINNKNCESRTLERLLLCEHPFLHTYAQTLLENR